MSTYHVLYNPLSGNGRGQAQVMELKEKMKSDELQFHDITKIGAYPEFLASLPKEDKILISGGDGTLHKFVNDMDEAVKDWDIYYNATGSGNDFLTDLGKTKEDCPILVNEYIRDLPKVTINGKTTRFMNNVGFGIDGYCCEEGDKLRAKSDKPINYTSIAIQGLLFKFKPANAVVIVDGVKHEYKKVWLAPTMKGRYYGGGMKITPDQNRLDADRKVSFATMYGSGKLKTLMVFPSIFKGEHVKHTEMVEIIEGHEIEVTFDRPIAAQIDGETIVGVTNYKVSAK